MEHQESYISVIHYQPGHAGLKTMVEKTVHAYKKQDPKRKFFIYKPVDGKPGTAYCVITQGKFGLLKKELGDTAAQATLDAAKSAVTSVKSFKSRTVRHGNRFNHSTPYLAVVRVQYDPKNAEKIRQFVKKMEQHSASSNKSSVFTVKGKENTFYIAFGVDNIEILDKKGGLMSYVTDPEIKKLYNEFKELVNSMELIKLRLLPQFSNCN